MDLKMASCSVELNSLPEKKKRKKLNKRRKALKDSNDTNHDYQEGTSLIKDTPLHIDSHVEPVINISSESAQSNVSLTRSQRKNLRKKIIKQKRKLENNDLQGCSSTVKTAPLEIESLVDISTKTNLESLTPFEIESAVDISTKTNLESLPLNSDLCLSQKKNISSESAQSNVSLTRSQKKNLRKKIIRQKRKLENNDLQGCSSTVKTAHLEIESSVDISTKTNLESLTPLEIESAVDISTKTNLESLPLNSDLCLSQKKRKRKKQKRKHNADDDLRENSFTEHMSLEKDSYSQPPVNICLKNESGVAEPNAVISLSLEKSEGKEGNGRHNASQNNGVDRDLQMANGKHIENKDLKSVSKVAELELINMKEKFLVPEKQSSLPIIANTTLMEKHDVHPEVDPVASEMKVINSYRRKKNRKRRKTSDSSGNSLEPMNKDGMRQTSFDHLEATHTADLSENKLDSILIRGCATLVQVSEDIEMKEGSANCLDGEPSSKESNKLDVIKVDADLDVTVKKDYPPHVLHPSPEQACIGCPKKKLLILDVNGLLADIVPYVPAGYKPDIWVSKKAVFKRPFCDDFLRFCFERFDVGVWSSRAKINVDRVINFLMGNSRRNLLFCWNQSHCTSTRFRTLENTKKPLVLKELKKLWEKRVPYLPWEKGEYNKANTLLLDDSPYKALRNPANTAIFPYSYSYMDEKDSSLGPEGDLRKYLEKLVMAENVQNYVEQNPFGQQAITESSPSWDFYSKVIGTKLMPT